MSTQKKTAVKKAAKADKNTAKKRQGRKSSRVAGSGTSRRTARSKRETASLTATELRRQQVARQRIILGCAALSVIVIVFAAFILPRFSHRTVNRGKLVGVNSDVLQYADAVASQCKEFGISEYSTLLLALMQQESSGQGTDIFQCSESPFNTEYDNTPGSIADTAYSIRVGVETFAYCLEQAECKSISDTNALKLALQEYNFGNDYAGWAIANYGGYSEENALEFSEKMKAELGWETYGDPQYVSHVLQYIEL